MHSQREHLRDQLIIEVYPRLMHKDDERAVMVRQAHQEQER